MSQKESESQILKGEVIWIAKYLEDKRQNFENTCERDKKKILKDINDDSKPFPDKRACPDRDGSDPTMEVEIV